VPCIIAKRHLEDEHQLGELELGSATARLEANRVEVPLLRSGPIPFVARCIELNGGAAILGSNLDETKDGKPRDPL